MALNCITPRSAVLRHGIVTSPNNKHQPTQINKVFQPQVCAIQHVDVCMFNNGKFKNVVAESEIVSPGERTVSPGSALNSTIILQPKRGRWSSFEILMKVCIVYGMLCLFMCCLYISIYRVTTFVKSNIFEVKLC